MCAYEVEQTLQSTYGVEGVLTVDCPFSYPKDGWKWVLFPTTLSDLQGLIISL